MNHFIDDKSRRQAKGFRFETSTFSRYFGVHWNFQMEKFIGVEGIVKGVIPEINVEFEFNCKEESPFIQPHMVLKY